MNIQSYIPGVICIMVALALMFCLMHYARFYAESYFFWIGAILAIVGIISLIKPLAFLFVFNRTVAVAVLCGGLLISILSIYWPVPVYHSQTNLKIDEFLPEYSFNEYHEVKINASPEKVKYALQTTGVKDIPAALFLMKIRGIAGDKDLSDQAKNNQADPETLVTPDFNFFVVDSSELITFIVIKATAKTPPPEIKSAKQFLEFKEPGYVKVAMNFRLIRLENGQTLLTTETRNDGTTQEDRRHFGRYWRIIYPGSAIIRRVWLDTLAKKAE
ncbi:MAG: hypothetical protein PHF34_07540 [Bacteroidales bacterium]|nr:hypothetical protein [Bacteroidales bacterium]